MSTRPPAAAESSAPHAFDFVTRRPVAISMLMVAVAMFGLVSLQKLPMDLLPEISYPTLTVRTAWEGAAPEDIEDRISVRIQETLATLQGLVRTSSVSRAGYSDVVLEYEWGTDMTFALQDVRDKLDQLFLPANAGRPLILRYDPNLDPILRLGVTDVKGAADLRGRIHLRWLAEKKIKRELESLPGVAAVIVRGGLQEEIRVRVDPFKLNAHSIDPSEVAARLKAENLNASGGMLRDGSSDYLVRTLNEFQSLQEIEELPLVQRGETIIRVGDVARVERTHKKREVITRMNGAEAVEVAIYREAGANIVEVADLVKARIFGTDKQKKHTQELAAKIALGEEQRGSRWADRSLEEFLDWRLRREANLELLSDQSTFIRAAINDVKQAAFLGALFAVAVMWLFLRRFTTTFIVALSIPISVIVTFAPMFLLDVSLNIMSLGGLALGVGMLVDNAIVVLESITRCREEGDSLGVAAVRGVSEVSGAIIASTLTTVAVFAPIVFVHGIAGQIFGDQAVTVVSSLIASLLVAILFIPMLASRSWLTGEFAAALSVSRPARPLEGLQWGWGSVVASLLTLVGRLLLRLFGLLVVLAGGLGWLAARLSTAVLWPFRRAFDSLWQGVERTYDPLLRKALAHPTWVLLAVSALGYSAWLQVPKLGVELLGEIRQGEFTAHVGLGVESPLENTEAVLLGLDRDIRALDGVEITALTVGVEADTLTRKIEGENTARLGVRLAPEARNFEGEERVLAEVRALFDKHPEVRTLEITRPTPFALAAPVAVEIRGHNLDDLEQVAADVEARLEGIEALFDIQSTQRPGHPEARVVFDREKTLEFGLDLAAVSNLVRDQLLGNVATRFVEGEERIDIRVLGDELLLATLDDVLELKINPSALTPLPLNAVARVELVRGPAEIRRIGNSRAVVLSAESVGLDLQTVNRRITSALADLENPDEVFVELGGQKRELDEGQASMRFALLLAMFLVYVVMASQFESLIQPLIIMLTVPLAGVGVVFALALLSIPLSVVVFIGLILLAGIVVNNAIVLVDRINKKRAAGLDLLEAILEAGHARLRPIFMTTLTTALGLLPLTGWLAGMPILGELGSGEGSEIRAPMAITVIAGLLSSTLLTLIVIPVVYSLVMGLFESPRQSEEQAA
ncbi:MAG: efflux RND transporter permease subunit [bacterium]|nr:efflux RND transporter permease subunit [Planctomycetota bacterium]HIL51962.1 efflux RND transporter permease subunit [Planctomycetota bacterium]